MNSLTKKNILFGVLFTSFSTPIIFFMMGLPMILQIKGFDPSIIGLFQIVGIPTVIKFLLSPPVDRIKFSKNHYKKWIYLTAFIYILLLIVISFLSLDDNINLVFIAVLLTALVSAFIDIPLNALAIKVFKEDERLSAGSYKISAYFIAGLLGGGVFLLAFNHLGWSSTFLLMTFMVFISLFTLTFIDESNEVIKEQKVSFKTVFSFFKQKDIGIWIFILSFYFAFISAVWIFMKPYLIKKGISPDNVAIYVGIYGSIIGAFGGAFANYISKKFNKKILLLIFMIFNFISVLILVLIEHFAINEFSLFLIAISFTALAIALSSAIVFSMIMDYSRKESRAVDYAVQSSLFAFTRILSAVIAGVFVSNFGFEGMFIFELLGIVFVLFVIYKFFKRKED